MSTSFELIENLSLMGLYVKPHKSTTSKFDSLSHWHNSEGLISFSYSCVPFGNKFKIYSPPKIAPRYDLIFLLIVDKKSSPSGFKRETQDLIMDDGLGTCSSISMQVMVSKLSLWASANASIVDF